MSGPARRFFSGDTETLAVMEAAGHFGLTPAELAYRPVEKKHGFLRRPKVVIEVDPASPKRATPVAAPAAPPGNAERAAAGRPAAAAPDAPRRAEIAGAPARAERRPEPVPEVRRREGPGEAVDHGPFEGSLTGVDGAEDAAAAVVALSGLRLTAKAEVVPSPDGDEVRVELAGPGRQALLDRQGELLGTCEHLVRRMVHDLPPGGLSLDSGGFREERIRTLRRRAAAAAEEVRRSGEAVTFEPLPAAERRILHLAVEAEAGVVSESAGEGERRCVRVLPTGGGRADQPS